MTFGEAVTGAAVTEITQPVTVPGLGASEASFVLPFAAAPTPTRPAATPSPTEVAPRP